MSFGSNYARNVVIFGVDNSTLSHSDNRKNHFLILGEGNTFGINGSFGAPEKRSGINFRKANTKSCLSLHYNADSSSISLTPTIKVFIFQLNFVSKVYLIDLVLVSLGKYLLMEICMIFQSVTILLINLTNQKLISIE